MNNNNDWITSINHPEACAFSLQYQAQLAKHETEIGTIQLFETEQWGNLLFVDDQAVLSTRENFFYHEMLVHPALFRHPAPKAVAVLGGADCGAVHEVLKHPTVKQLIQVDDTPLIGELASRYFAELCVSNQDARLKQVSQSPLTWLQAQQDESLDILLIDDKLLRQRPDQALIQQCQRVLKPGGIIALQTGSPLFNINQLADTRESLSAEALTPVAILTFPQPLFAGGWWSCTLAIKGEISPRSRELDIQGKPFATLYYNWDIHQSSQALPAYLRGVLEAG